MVVLQNAAINTCLACGHKADALGPDGVFVTFNDRQADVLVRFLRHEFDVGKCEACHASLNIAPTIVVLRTAQCDALVVPGPRMVGREGELIATFHKEGDFPCQVLPTLDDLRSAVESEIKRRLTSLSQVFEARLKGQFAEYVVEHWRELDGASFAALIVATTVQIPGVGFSIGWSAKDGSMPTPDDFMRSLGLVQGSTWIALGNSWMRSKTHSGSLETDLAVYVDDAPVLPGSVERLQEFCGRLRKVSDNGGTHYMIGALQASVYRAAALPNPDYAQWSAIFFKFEIAALEQGDAFPEHWRAMLVSPERAAATLSYEHTWNAVGEFVQEIMRTNPPDRAIRSERIEAVATKAGHPGITTDVLTKGRVLEADSKDVPYETFEDMARLVAAKTNDPEVFFSAMKTSADFLVRHDRLMDIVRLTDLAIELVGDSHENQARADTWLGRYLKKQRQPNLFFARAGDTARDWEHELPLDLRGSLWTERANALRLAGRPADALAIHQQLDIELAVAGSEDQRHTNRLNRGIIERETGALDASVATLRGLLAELPATGERRIDALASLATTMMVLRDAKSALSLYDEALKLAIGPYSERADELRPSRSVAAMALASAVEMAPPSWDGLHPGKDGNTIIGIAGAWIMAIGRHKVPLAAERADQLVALLDQTSKEAATRQDALISIRAQVAAGALLNALDRDEDAFQHWLQALRQGGTFDLPPNEMALVRVAHGCYLMGDAAGARTFLRTLPHSLAASVGNVKDIAVAAESTAALSSAFQKLAEVVLFVPEAKAGWPDVRLVAELARDAVSRARAQRRLGADAGATLDLEAGLDDSALAALAPPAGTVCVLEWIESSQGVGGFVTRIGSDRGVKSSWIEYPDDVDLGELAQLVHRRLAAWLPDDEDDPFDFPEWHTLEHHLQRQLDPLVGPDGHIVIIEHEAYAGLPWHVALRRWSCSYTSGWDRLLREAAADKRPAVSRLGVAVVPRVLESTAVEQALESSVRRTETIAAKHGVRLLVRAGEACDGEAFVDLLARVDALKLLCHGFVGRDGGISLMLAHGGQLPLANSVAAGSAIGTPHRVSWRELQTLKAAPRVVFSAACSSGQSTIAGMGERLGLHSALVHAGTSAIVAPLWNIVAAEVIPVLDDICDAHVEGVPLGRAVHEASRRAAATRHTWLAWALALEGDWR